MHLSWSEELPSFGRIHLSSADNHRSIQSADTSSGSISPEASYRKRRLEAAEAAFLRYFAGDEDQAGAEAFSRKSQADVLTATLAYSIYLKLHLQQ